MAGVHRGDGAGDAVSAAVYLDEGFAEYDYKIIKWVKVRPRYCEYHGGRLAGKSILHDAEQEFVEILKKYSVPYEVERGTYIIYGYRQ